jgi:hypothetical protein
MLANLSAVSDAPRATLPLLINAANQHSFKLIFEIHVFVNRTIAWFTKSRKTIDTRCLFYIYSIIKWDSQYSIFGRVLTHPMIKVRELLGLFLPGG